MDIGLLIVGIMCIPFIILCVIKEYRIWKEVNEYEEYQQKEYHKKALEIRDIYDYILEWSFLWNKGEEYDRS